MLLTWYLSLDVCLCFCFFYSNVYDPSHRLLGGSPSEAGVWFSGLPMGSHPGQLPAHYGRHPRHVWHRAVSFQIPYLCEYIPRSLWWCTAPVYFKLIRRRCAVALVEKLTCFPVWQYAVWLVLWVGWNSFIICFYLEVGNLSQVGSAPRVIVTTTIVSFEYFM